MRFNRTIVLTACLAIFMTFPIAAAGEEEEIPRLTVHGEGEVRVPADQLRLNVGVVTTAPAVEEALAENTKRMREVVAALHRAGLGEEEYETGRLRIEPQWSPPPRNPSPEWQRQIVGYRALNALRVRTRKIAAAGDLIAAAAAAGANDIGGIIFDLADPRRHRAEAIRAATMNALADARALADAADVRLARVLTLTLDQTSPYPVPMAAERMMAVDAGAPPVTPGDVTVRAGVTVTYEIESAGGETPRQ